MTEASSRPVAKYQDDDDFSLLSLGSVLLRRRRWILAVALLGGILGLVSGLLRSRLYVSTATFVPEASENGSNSGLALAASQFGIRVPTANAGWGPVAYMQLFRTRALLEPVALDSISVAEEGQRRRAVSDLLGVDARDPAMRSEMAVSALRNAITASELPDLNAVKISVVSKWPSVSLALAQKLVVSVNEFNLRSRKSQATAERQFVETRTADAEASLRQAEDRLQAFMQENRVWNSSPQLSFAHDRLERDVQLRQQAYTSLVVSREEARIREVRDIPVITILDAPRLPIVPESRKTGQRAILGALAGAVLAILLSLVIAAVQSARRKPSPAASEFFNALNEATPRLLRRNSR